ncbi:helix-turn-helix domain-containing protein [Nocardia sp. NPDC050713]|uniref:PucR family transcriptional regulator n=1 Tax=Nocardia sp. NPDC050713 TaxID=3154511 RepID=UPI0033C140C9
MHSEVARPRSDGDVDRTFRELASVLSAQEDYLVDRQVTTVWDELRVYNTLAVPMQSIEGAARRNLHRAVHTLWTSAVPVSDLADETWIARERIEQGVPTEDMLDGYRRKHRTIRDRFLDIATSLRTPSDAVVRALTLLSDSADEGASRLLHTRREIELQRKGRDSLREQFICDLLHGRLDGSMIPREAAAYGLRPEATWYAIRARTTTGDSDRLRSEIQSRTWDRDGRTGVLAVIDDEVIGLVPLGSVAGMDRGMDGVVGVGDGGPVSDAASSYRNASRALMTATQFGLTGFVNCGDLGLRLAIASNPDVSELLIRRYLTPLRINGRFGEVLEITLCEFLRSHGELKRTARILGVHLNTLKHRLSKIEQLIGQDLTDPRTVAELWWAIEAGTVSASVSGTKRPTYLENPHGGSPNGVAR